MKVIQASFLLLSAIAKADKPAVGYYNNPVYNPTPSYVDYNYYDYDIPDYYGRTAYNKDYEAPLAPSPPQKITLDQGWKGIEKGHGSQAEGLKLVNKYKVIPVHENSEEANGNNYFGNQQYSHQLPQLLKLFQGTQTPQVPVIAHIAPIKLITPIPQISKYNVYEPVFTNYKNNLGYTPTKSENTQISQYNYKPIQRPDSFPVHFQPQHIPIPNQQAIQNFKSSEEEDNTSINQGYEDHGTNAHSHGSKYGHEKDKATSYQSFVLHSYKPVKVYAKYSEKSHQPQEHRRKTTSKEN